MRVPAPKAAAGDGASLVWAALVLPAGVATDEPRRALADAIVVVGDHACGDAASLAVHASAWLGTPTIDERIAIEVRGTGFRIWNGDELRGQRTLLPAPWLDVAVSGMAMRGLDAELGAGRVRAWLGLASVALCPRRRFRRTVLRWCGGVATGADNEGFYRGDTSLFVVVNLTDEDDDPEFSTMTPAAAIDSITDFTGGAGRYVLVTIAGPEVGNCPPFGDGGNAFPAPRLHEFTGLATFGLMGDVCSADLARGEKILRRLLSFFEPLPSPRRKSNFDEGHHEQTHPLRSPLFDLLARSARMR